MEILIRYINIYNGSFVLFGFIVIIITSIIYFKRRNQRRHFNKLKVTLITAYNQSIKQNNKIIFKNTIDKTLSSGSLVLIVAFFAKKQRHEVQELLPFFAEETFQTKLRALLHKGTVQQRVDAANMLSYYPCQKSFIALEKACSDPRQEVAIAAALSLVISNPDVSLVELITKLFNSIPQKGLFCFLRLIPSYNLLQFESQVIDEESSNFNSTLLTMLREISNNYITPYVMFAREDQRDYMQQLFETLLGLQCKASGIIHSCYILNFINELCYQDRICNIQELITKNFNFDTKLFVYWDDINNSFYKNKVWATL